MRRRESHSGHSHPTNTESGVEQVGEFAQHQPADADGGAVLLHDRDSEQRPPQAPAEDGR